MKRNKKLVILSILFTPNNILFTLTCLNGKVLFWTSSGTKKIKGTKKISISIILLIINNIIEYLYKFNYNFIYIKTKGFNKNKKNILKYFKFSFLKILLISDETFFPHNGCKKSKLRRI